MLRAMWSKLLRGLGCLAYLGMLGVVFALVAYVAFSLFVRGGVTATPDLTGLSRDDATALLADQGLRPVWLEDQRFDEKVPKSHVLIQKPRAGVYVKRNTEVNLTLSKGPRRIEVPDLGGQAIQAAQVSLVAAGLTLGRSFDVYSQEGKSGLVVAQSPAPGTRVEVDAPVDLFISSENTAQVYLMPDLVRRDYEDVRSFFESRGFRIGRVSYETYAGVRPGTILRQFPLAGHPLHRDDVISLGVVAPTVPDPALVDPTLADPASTDPASTDPTLADPTLADPGDATPSSPTAPVIGTLRSAEDPSRGIPIPDTTADGTDPAGSGRR
jgi:beta-lactam-binding protein with PASTA domain